MSLFYSYSTSSSGAVISKLAPQQALFFLYPAGFTMKMRSASTWRHRHSVGGFVGSSSIGIESWFISSLAVVGHCHEHVPKFTQSSTFFAPHRPGILKKRREVHQLKFQRHQHTQKDKTDLEEESQTQPNYTREELMALVDQYSGGSYTDQLPLLELPNLYQPSDGPHLTISDNAEEDWPPPQWAWPAKPATKETLQNLELAVQDKSKNPEEIYQLYRALPEPRAPYIEAKVRHKMLHRLSSVEQKDEQSMLRYLSVIDDMRGVAIPLITSEWNSAISFVARYVSKSTEVEVEAALHMWRDMEHVAGVKGNDVTFNVLFDVACKAGKFTLAEMIYKEMETRGLEFNRFHHVSLIFYHGLKGNGDGARVAYRSLVDAGEIVDTVVLNAMISALFRSNEPTAAENIYERMKSLHFNHSKSRLQPHGFKSRRRETLVLKRWAIIAKRHKTKRERLQKNAIIAPDIKTFQILVSYFAIQVGDLDKTAQFLDEMKWFRVGLHGSLFFALLKGFALHGGVRYTRWTEERLESVWKSLVWALDNDVEDLHISKWMAIWTLRAFAKCSGKSRTIEVWEEIQQRWDPGESEWDFVMSHLRRLLEGPDMTEKRHDWVLGSQ